MKEKPDCLTEDIKRLISHARDLLSVDPITIHTPNDWDELRREWLQEHKQYCQLQAEKVSMRKKD